MVRAVALLLLASLLLAALAAGGTAGGFEASFPVDAVVTGGETTLSTTAHAETSVEITADELGPDALSEMIDGSVVTDDGVRTTLGENGSVAVAVPRRFRCRPDEYLGNHTFTVRKVATNETATASVDVVAPMDAGYASFERAVFHVEPGRPAAIRFDGCERGLKLVVGDDNSPFAANATMEPTDEPWSIVIETSRVANGSADDVFRPGENTTIEGSTVERRPADGPLPEGEYPLSLSVDGDEADVAILNVTTNTPTPSPTPTATTSPTATESPTPTGTEATTDFPTATPTTEPPTETTSPTDSRDQSPTSSLPDGVAQPGFGPEVALVAGAAAAALLALRR